MANITEERRAALAARVARSTSRIALQLESELPGQTVTAADVELALASVDRATLTTVTRLAEQAIRAIPGSLIDAGDVAHNVIIDIATGRAKDGAKTLALLRANESEGVRRMRKLVTQRLIDDARRDGMMTRSAEIVRWADAVDADQTIAKMHRQRVTVEYGPQRMSHGPLAHKDRTEREMVLAAIAASRDVSTLGVIAGGTNPNRSGDVRQPAEASEAIWQGNGGPRSDRDPSAAFLRDSGVPIRNVRETTIDRRMEVSNLAAKGRTQIVRGVTRLDRSQSLEDMLTGLNEQKVHRVFDGSETDYYLVGPLGRKLADKWDIAHFRETFPNVLNRTAAGWSGRGKSQLADAIDRLASRDAESWRRLAVMLRNVERSTEEERSTATEERSTATKEQRRAAATAASAAQQRATRAANAAQLAHHLAIVARARQVTLADVVLASVVPAWTDGAKRTDAHRSSALDIGSICHVIGMPPRGNGAAGLGQAIRTAAEAALDQPMTLSQSPGRWAWERELRSLDHPTATRSDWVEQDGRIVRTFGAVRASGPVDRLPAPVHTPAWLRDARQAASVTPPRRGTLGTPTFGLPGQLPKVGAAPELPAIVVTGDQSPTPRDVLRERLDALFARPARDESYVGRWVH
jgi:hypothetical protein